MRTPDHPAHAPATQDSTSPFAPTRSPVAELLWFTYYMSIGESGTVSPARPERSIIDKRESRSPVQIAYVVVTLVAVAANAFSGIAAMSRFKPIMATLGPAMAKAGVPESWLVFPIGILKTAGAVGLLGGLAGIPLLGQAAAIGLILFFVCAAYTHIRVSDYSPQFFLGSCFFLPLAVAALALNPAG